MALYGCELSASHPGGLTKGEKSPGTPCIRGWVGTGDSLGALEKKKSIDLAGN